MISSHLQSLTPGAHIFTCETDGEIFISTFAAVKATSAIDPNGIVYHISIAARDRQQYLQLIIVDRFEYNELSTRLMESLRENILDSEFASELQAKRR